MPAPSLASLLLQQTKATIYSCALSIATTIGLPVTSWQAGDPTRSLFYLEATVLEALENIVVGYIQSGFLDYATGTWLTILAKQVFNVDVPDAVAATTAVVLTNAGGGVYEIDAGDLTFENSTTGATYHNTDPGTLVLTAGGTLTVTVVADVAGASGTAASGEIDTLVTSFDLVTCTNPAAAVGVDVQSAATTVQQCRNKTGSLSPNGPRSAYSFVALSPTLTNTSAITRVRVYDDSDTGDVTIYVAGPSGAVGSPDVALVQAAINKWCAPLCITPTVVSANPVTVAVTYSLWIYQSVNQTSAQIQAAVETALENLFAARPIGGDVIPPATTGTLYTSAIADAIGDAFPDQTFRVVVSAPSGDTALGLGDVVQLGTVTPTVVIIADPV